MRQVLYKNLLFSRPLKSVHSTRNCNVLWFRSGTTSDYAQALDLKKLVHITTPTVAPWAIALMAIFFSI